MGWQEGAQATLAARGIAATIVGYHAGDRSVGRVAEHEIRNGRASCGGTDAGRMGLVASARVEARAPGEHRSLGRVQPSCSRPRAPVRDSCFRLLVQRSDDFYRRLSQAEAGETRMVAGYTRQLTESIRLVTISDSIRHLSSGRVCALR